ncbi:MAG: alpha/beta hydrolase [Chitinispirillaceae bacterium]|jgi:pimeloyl-ACP methyl ester carboxylesterase|nr:alpha/beta hydrolase [Chitinispirillaceae bacterium]
MARKWIVFGGWGVNASLLAPLFGSGATIIDTNSIMLNLIEHDLLVPDWQERCGTFIRPLLPDGPCSIAGWSTGAIIAAACAAKISPSAGVFIAATPSFCRRPEFTHGQKPVVLRAMREQLVRDYAALTASFHEQCGIGMGDRKQAGVPHGTASLTAGLFFLEQANLLPVSTFAFPSLFLHGKDDSIIPVSAGRTMAESAGGKFVEFDGPHAFFMAQREAVVAAIHQFTEGVS